MSEEDLSRVLRTLGFAGDVTPAKLAWAARIKTAQPVVAFLCSGALGMRGCGSGQLVPVSFFSRS